MIGAHGPGRVGPACVLVAVCLGLGCAPTDTGNPPFEPPPPTIERPRLEAEIQPGLVETAFTVSGQPGAVDPPKGEIVFMDLERPTEITRAPVLEDGSFSSGPLSGAGRRFRMWVEGENVRSAPFDFVVDAQGITAAPELLDACVTFDPAGFVDFGPAAGEGVMRESATVHNGCGGELSVGATLRGGSEAFGISAVPGAPVPAGESAVVEVEVDGAKVAPGSRVVDAVWIEVMGARSGRHAVTLLAGVPQA